MIDAKEKKKKKKKGQINISNRITKKKNAGNYNYSEMNSFKQLTQKKRVLEIKDG